MFFSSGGTNLHNNYTWDILQTVFYVCFSDLVIPIKSIFPGGYRAPPGIYLWLFRLEYNDKTWWNVTNLVTEVLKQILRNVSNEEESGNYSGLSRWSMELIDFHN